MNTHQIKLGIGDAIKGLGNIYHLKSEGHAHQIHRMEDLIGEFLRDAEKSMQNATVPQESRQHYKIAESKIYSAHKLFLYAKRHHLIAAHEDEIAHIIEKLKEAHEALAQVR